MIAFLFSPLGRWVGAVVIAFSILTGAYASGHHNGAVSTDAKWRAAAAAEKARQDTANDEARAEAARIATALASKINELQNKVDANDAEAIRDSRAPACGVSSDGVRRLNSIH